MYRNKLFLVLKKYFVFNFSDSSPSSQRNHKNYFPAFPAELLEKIFAAIDDHDTYQNIAFCPAQGQVGKAGGGIKTPKTKTTRKRGEKRMISKTKKGGEGEVENSKTREGKAKGFEDQRIDRGKSANGKQREQGEETKGFEDQN